MTPKATSTRATPKATTKPIRAAAAKTRVKTSRMSKLEAKRLESFKALMIKYGGKLKFAGLNE